MLNYKFYNTSNNQNPVIIFIAGFTGTVDTWNKCCEELVKLCDNRILLIDNLGAGNSPQPCGEYTTTEMANEIIKVIEFVNIKRFYLIGHSLGGAIAQYIALSNPGSVKQMFLVSSLAKVDNICKFFLMGRYKLAKNNISKELIAYATLPSIFSDSYLNDEANTIFATQRIVSNPQTIDGMFGQLSACINHDTTKLVEQINTRTTIITGDKDILVAPEHSYFLNNKIHGSELVIIKNAAHMVQLEKPQELAETIYKNLSRTA